MTNFIRDRNAFQLAAPPVWWMRRLADFDCDLVVIPSRERPLFWLARRQQFSRAFSGNKFDVAIADDSKMFVTYNLVSVVTMISLTWSEQALLELLTWLKAADTWSAEGGPLDAAGVQAALNNGGSKVTKAMDEHDRRRDEALARRQRETIYHATGDGWRSLTARTGRRILNAGMPRLTAAGM